MLNSNRNDEEEPAKEQLKTIGTDLLGGLLQEAHIPPILVYALAGAVANDNVDDKDGNAAMDSLVGGYCKAYTNAELEKQAKNLEKEELAKAYQEAVCLKVFFIKL